VSEQYDVVIIGSGPGGYVAAIRAGQNGLRTALVEKAPKLGGTCLHVGCIPTKAMLHSAALYSEARHGKEFGVVTKDVVLDMKSVLKRKDRVVEKNARGVAYLMKKNKVDVIHGFGSYAGRGRVKVKDDKGGERILSTKNILLATGSVCRDFPAFPVDHERILNSDDMFKLGEIPKRFAVIGAGAVGTEFASMFMRFGSRVTLIELMDQILPIEDADIAAELKKSLKRQGMTIHTGTEVRGVEHTREGVRIRAKGPKGNDLTIEADVLLSAVGRSPVTSGIGIEGTGITLEKGFVLTDEFMRTGEPGVYAIGDIVPHAALAHVASAQGILAIDHMSGKSVTPINYDQIPNCTYSYPEVASVGLTERAARDRGFDVKTGTFPYPVNSKAAILGEREGLVKIVSEKRYDELLGIHIVGNQATNLITEGTVALALESTTESLAQVIHPHPTLSEAIAEAAHAALGHAIHI